MRVTGSRPDRPPVAAGWSAPNWSAPGLQPEFVWLVLWLVCVVAMVVLPAWQVIPFDLIWISLAALYGFRLWPDRRLLALTATAVATTAAAISDDAVRHLRLGEPVEQIPLLATLFVVLAWQAHRRVIARDRAEIAAEAGRLLTAQRQFLQDASHQLRTPITIALGHAELLAQELAGGQQRDIRVVVGELERLRALSERLLLVATSQNPDFLAPAPTDLDLMAAELLRRWQPTAQRRWRLGRLDPVTAPVDAERLGLAIDALVENAVRHTGTGDEITISVLREDHGRFARIVVQDTGDGIDEADLPRIFDRFATGAGAGSGSHGTGLGLALVQAVALGHSGDVSVQSAPGVGSRFDLLLPAQPGAEPRQGAQPGQPVRDAQRPGRHLDAAGTGMREAP